MSEVRNFISTKTSWIRARALEFTKNMADAEDLAQDVIVKMWKSRRSYQEGTEIQAWAYRIIRNTFITEYNRRQNRRTESIFYDEDSEEKTPLYDKQIHNEGPQSLFIENIYKYLDEVSTQEKNIFRFYLSGIQYEEISEIFEIPLGTIKNKIHKTKNYLKDKINQEEIYINGFMHSH
jgi:RNA polymerase sigma factor (sigma-70 family)